MNSTPSFSAKLLAISGTLALIIFMVLGFVFDAWAWAWVVFLVPGAIRTWQAVGQGDSEEAGRSGAAQRRHVSHEGDEPTKQVPPPQRYEG